jgi:hypothetical protein
MARLPGENYVIQQIDGEVVLYHDYTEEEIVRFDPSNGDAMAKAQRVIHFSDKLSDEDKCFAHVWSGYFYAHATAFQSPLA